MGDIYDPTYDPDEELPLCPKCGQPIQVNDETCGSDGYLVHAECPSTAEAELRAHSDLQHEGLGQAVAKISAQAARIEALQTAIGLAEKRFREYGDLHAAKPDAEKAKRNYDMADQLRAVLQGKP